MFPPPAVVYLSLFMLDFIRDGALDWGCSDSVIVNLSQAESQVIGV